MKKITTSLKSKMLSLLKKEKGATMVEYAIMLALIAIVSILVVQGLGTQVSSTFNRASGSLAAANG